VPAILDHNLFFTDAGATDASWVWQGVEHVGYTDYLAASGQDAHSLFADPQFIDPLAPDLRPQLGSPAIDAGAMLGVGVVGAVDFAGHARANGAAVDIGAYER